MVWGITGCIGPLAEGQVHILGHHGFGLVKSMGAGPQMVVREIGIGRIGGHAAGVQVRFGQGGMAEGHEEPVKAAYGPIRRAVPVLGQYSIPGIPAPVGGVITNGFQPPFAQPVIVVLHHRRFAGEIAVNPLEFVAPPIGIRGRVTLPTDGGAARSETSPRIVAERRGHPGRGHGGHLVGWAIGEDHGLARVNAAAAHPELIEFKGHHAVHTHPQRTRGRAKVCTGVQQPLYRVAPFAREQDH